jgi:hypothetical protein
MLPCIHIIICGKMCRQRTAPPTEHFGNYVVIAVLIFATNDLSINVEIILNRMLLYSEKLIIFFYINPENRTFLFPVGSKSFYRTNASKTGQLATLFVNKGLVPAKYIFFLVFALAFGSRDRQDVSVCVSIFFYGVSPV